MAARLGPGRRERWDEHEAWRLCTIRWRQAKKAEAMLSLAGLRGLSMFAGLPIAFAQKEGFVTLSR